MKRQEEARGCMGKYEEVLEEGRGPRVPRFVGSKVQAGVNIFELFADTWTCKTEHIWVYQVE